jgi:mannosyltransferase OCH1-like enzyme
MIPKIIHYLWLSDIKPESIISCLDSWKEPLKDYEIIEWNRTNFPYNDFLWTREANLSKKWAFVTDFFRLWVLKKYGGIYMDADVVVYQNFDSFLHLKMFIGTEFMYQLEAQVIGAVPNHPFIEKCLTYYDNRHFIVDSKFDMIPLPRIMTNFFVEHYHYNKELANFSGKPLILDDITVYDETYFTISQYYNENNICYHKTMGSWDDKKQHPTMENMMEHYYLLKFFTTDIFRKKSKMKYLVFLMPVFVLTLFFKWRMKLKNHRKLNEVKR